MFEWVPIIVTVVTSIAATITVTLGLRALLKRPHIFFQLQKADFRLFNQEQEEKLSLLLASIANRKKPFFGEMAKKVSVLVLFRAPSDDNWPGLNASAGLPWLKSFGGKKRIVEQMRSEGDIKRALEEHVLDRTDRDMPQGRGEFLVVAYGVEKSNKLYLAANPPIEIPLPPHIKTFKKRKIAFTGCFFRLEIAGENLPSTLSPGSVIFGDSWTNWSFPKKVRTIATPSKFKNLLLRLGIGRKVKVIESMSIHED